MPTAKPTGKIRYVGTADVREITANDFKRVGVEAGKTVRWNAENGKVVDRADLDFLSAEDFDRIIGQDAGFKVED